MAENQLTESHLDQIEYAARAMLEKYPTPWRIHGKDSWRLEGFPQVEYSDAPISYIRVHDDVSARYYVAVNPNAVLALIAALREAQPQLGAGD